MKVEIFTMYDQVVIELLNQLDLLRYAVQEDPKKLIFLYSDAEPEQDIRTWIAAAMSCGLIEGGYVR